MLAMIQLILSLLLILWVHEMDNDGEVSYSATRIIWINSVTGDETAILSPINPVIIIICGKYYITAKFSSKNLHV